MSYVNEMICRENYFMIFYLWFEDKNITFEKKSEKNYF